MPWRERVTRVVHEYVELCDFRDDLKYDNAEFSTLYQHIADRIAAYGLDMHDKLVQRTVLEGAHFAVTAFQHLPSLETKVYVGVYTALVIQVDDACESALRDSQHDVIEDVVNFAIVSHARSLADISH